MLYKSGSQPLGFYSLYLFFLISQSSSVKGFRLFNYGSTYPSTGNSFADLFYSRTPPEAFLSTRELATKSGSPYNFEEHQVTTFDGYILTVFKVSQSSQRTGHSGTKEPVLLLHGFWQSSDEWFLPQFTEDSLPYILTQRGHEVWLGNFRGNGYSTHHTNLTQDDLRYWDFSYDEMGRHDIPALINYILKESNQDSMSYIGFSLGTTAFFIAMDRHPELQPKLKKMIALAPAAYGSQTRTLWKSLSLISSNILINIFNTLSGGRILPPILNNYLRENVPRFCSRPFISRLCLYFAFLTVGTDFEQTTKDTASLFFGHLFSPTSSKTLAHMFQLIRSPQFLSYDYGEKGNMEKYGSVHPIRYNLSRIVVPIKVLYGLNDPMVVPEDALRTIKDLGNVVEWGPVNFTQWTHIDFIFARDVKKLVYDQCAEFLE